MDDLTRTCPHCFRAYSRGLDPKTITVPSLSTPSDSILVGDASAHGAALLKSPADKRIEAVDRYDTTPREKTTYRVERLPILKSTVLGLSAPKTRMERNAIAAHLRSGKEIRVVCKDKDIDLRQLKSEIAALWERQHGCCARTGIPFDESSHWLHASLDRIDSAKGYIPGNLQSVTWFYNRTKGTIADEDFVYLARLHFGRTT
jgi:hypothetical protein